MAPLIVLASLSDGHHRAHTYVYTRLLPYVHFQSPSTMIYLTDDEKRRIFEGVQPMLTEWAGNVKLVPTSCYGVRLVRVRSVPGMG